ncbi:MAG: flagellar assembly protein A [Treponemataceae bacterium]
MAGTIIKGAVSIEIDALEVEAKLRFIPAKDGEDWSAERVLQLIAEKRIAPAPAARSLEDIFQKLAKVKDPTAVVIARGTPPVEPVGESVLWIDLPLPEELKSAAEDILVHARPPELYRIRVEKIKRETVVKKPAPLPFLPPKEEIVITYDKKETREQVSVDPTVQERAYAEKGQKIGTFGAPKPGKPGKSVFGKTIPALAPPDVGFLTGEGIVRDKNELRATCSGVLRIGSSWADIVPLGKPVWKVEKGADGITIFLHFEPGAKSLPQTSAADVISAAVALGVLVEDLCPETEVADILTRSTRSGEPIEAFALSRRKDGEVLVDFSPDKIKATLTMRKAVGGGKPLELKEVAAVIKNSAVRGFSAEKVKADILAFFNGPTLALEGYVLFEGRAPTRGKDREIQAAVAFLNDQLRAELIERIASSPRAGLPTESDDFFPPKEATHIAFVEKDALVASVTQPPSGVAGVDALGAALPGLPGNDPDIKTLIGLRISRNEVRADYSGVLLVRREGSTFAAFVLPYRDSKVTAEITADGMSASITLEKEEGAGTPLNADAVNKELAAAGVTHGLIAQAIPDALLEALEKGKTGPTVIARGEPPVAGGAMGLKWLVHVASGKGVTLREDGKADFKNQDRFVSVAEGTALVEVTKQGEDGRAGFDVTGKALDPQKAETVDIAHDDSVREEPIENGVRLVAARTGEISYDGKTLKVNALHGIKGDVGPASGNVKFPGEVRISGGVKSGFAVLGGGDVYITEVAESALVSSGGKVVIGQGVIGAGKGIVRARLGIEASFVEQATLLAVEDVKIKNGCLQSQIKTNGKLRLLGDKGHLIGGVCRARQGVEAANIGSERGTRTEISFGQDYLIKDQIESIEREVDKVKAALADIDAKIKAMERAGAKLDIARTEKIRIMKYMEKLVLKLFTLREKFEEHNESEVRVRGNVFPGVVMESHGRYFEVKQKKNQVVFVFDRDLGRIQEKPLK